MLKVLLLTAESKLSTISNYLHLLGIIGMDTSFAKGDSNLFIETLADDFVQELPEKTFESGLLSEKKGSSVKRDKRQDCVEAKENPAPERKVEYRTFSS